MCKSRRRGTEADEYTLEFIFGSAIESCNAVGIRTFEIQAVLRQLFVTYRQYCASIL